MRKTQTLPFPSILCVIAAVLIGCETTQRGDEPRPTDLPEPDRTGEAEGAGPIEFGESSDPTAIEDVGDLLPLEAADQTYEVVEGDESGSTVTVRIEEAENPDDPSMPWRRHTPGGRIEHLGIDEDGSIVMGAVEDIEHNALTYYDPPMMILPADLEPGETRTFTSEARVVHRSDPDKGRGGGTSEKQITHEADQIITTPAGRFECRRFETVYTADLSLADVEVTSTEWYAPGEGLIAEDYHERIKALVIINIDKERKMVRTEE